MVEMISVIAVVSVITVVAVAGFQKMLTKHKANTVISESRMAYIEGSSRQTVENLGAWSPVSFMPSYGLSMEVMRDYNAHDYVMIKKVPSEICKQILSMKVENKLDFLGSSYEGLTSCDDETDMVVAWNGEEAPMECRTDADCPAPAGASSFEGVCVDGRCISCRGGRYDAEQGACLCEGQYEVLEQGACVCQDRYFKNEENVCISCFVLDSIKVSKEECDRCPGRMYTSSGQCEAARFKRQGNTYAWCNSAGSVRALESECAKCDNSNSPRQYEAIAGNQYGYCFLKNCREGEFREADRDCTECSLDVELVPLNDAECAKCNNTATPRRMFEGTCFICGPGNFIGADPPGTFHWDADCLPCDLMTWIPWSTAEECARCNNTPTPRKMVDGYCKLLTCPEGYFMDQTETCQSCSDPHSYAATASACEACDATNTPRTMVSGYCALDAECSSGEFKDIWGECIECDERYDIPAEATECAKCTGGFARKMKDGRCIPSCSSGSFLGIENEYYEEKGITDWHYMTCESCSVNYRVPSNATECAACDNTGNPRLMTKDGYCIRDVACESGNFKETDYGSCASCSEEYAPVSTSTECARCDNTNTPRVMINGHCALATCPTGSFRSSDGACVSCDVPMSYLADATECAKCSNSGTPRVMVNGACALDATCETGGFKDIWGGCMACEFPYDFPATSTECAKCANTDYPRKMKGDRCVPACSSGQFLIIDPEEFEFNGVNLRYMECTSCYDSAAPSDATECAACDNTDNPRHMSNGICVGEYNNGGGIS